MYAQVDNGWSSVLITITKFYTVGGSKEIYYDFNLLNKKTLRMVPENTLTYWKEQKLYRPINGIKRATIRIKSKKGTH